MTFLCSIWGGGGVEEEGWGCRYYGRGCKMKRRFFLFRAGVQDSMSFDSDSLLTIKKKIIPKFYKSF